MSQRWEDLPWLKSVHGGLAHTKTSVSDEQGLQAGCNFQRVGNCGIAKASNLTGM